MRRAPLLAMDARNSCTEVHWTQETATLVWHAGNLIFFAAANFAAAKSLAAAAADGNRLAANDAAFDLLIFADAFQAAHLLLDQHTLLQHCKAVWHGNSHHGMHASWNAWFAAAGWKLLAWLQACSPAASKRVLPTQCTTRQGTNARTHRHASRCSPRCPPHPVTSGSCHAHAG